MPPKSKDVTTYIISDAGADAETAKIVQNNFEYFLYQKSGPEIDFVLGIRYESPILKRKRSIQMPAPRKALAPSKRSKRLLPQLSESERREGLDKLTAIKTKHAPRALELVRKALFAVIGLQALEEVRVMSEEVASAVHAQYNTVFSEFKLTFEAADGYLAVEMDHEFIGLQECEH